MYFFQGRVNEAFFQTRDMITNSNILRVALLYSVGGTYLDLDLISAGRLSPESCHEYTYIRLNNLLMTSFMTFRKGSKFLWTLLSEMVIFDNRPTLSRSELKSV